MMPVKTSLRDKLEDDVLDLSLMQLSDVPVKEIAALPKGTTLDLSNNLLTWLPENFSTLSHLVKLDLSKNRLTELPEYFGQLRNLRHLDLYSNQLERLPVSFAQLKNLKWLDLKNNPLVPALAQAAGPCITTSDCTMCAKKVVALLQSMQSQLERERQRRVIEEQKAEKIRLENEEAERERLRAEKRAAKERRREEARAKESEARKRGDHHEHNSNMQHEMERPRNDGSSGGGGSGLGSDGSNVDNGRANMNSNHVSNKKSQSGGWLWSILVFFFGLGIVTFGACISLLWIYTGGHLDQRSIEKALPVLRRDIDTTMLTIEKKVNYYYVETEKWAGPYTKGVAAKAKGAWKELARRNEIVAHYINDSLGPYFCYMKKESYKLWKLGQAQIRNLWDKTLKPHAAALWSQARPYFQKLGQFIVESSLPVYEFLKVNIPFYYDLLLQKSSEMYQNFVH